MGLYRRIRGIAGAAALWALAFSAVGVVFVSVASLFSEHLLISPALLARVAGRWASVGCAAGVVFASVVIMAERRRTFAALSARRFALWGVAAGGVLAPAVIVALGAVGQPTGSRSSQLVFAAVCAIGGGCIAAASLHTARRAVPTGDYAEDLPPAVRERGTLRP